MEKCRVLFYRAEWDGHFIDDAISLWTWPWNIGTEPYSHCELWLPSENNDFGGIWPVGKIRIHKAHQFYFKGQCFTSTMRGEDNGTVLRPAVDILTHPKRWDVTEEIEIIYPIMMQRHIDYEVQNNKGYDNKCIVSFFTPWRFHDPDKNICPEAVKGGLYVGTDLFGTLQIWSPRRFSRKLIKKGIKIGPLKDMLKS